MIYIGLKLEKYLNYFPRLGLILDILEFDLGVPGYHTGFGLILWYNGLGLEKH